MFSRGPHKKLSLKVGRKTKKVWGVPFLFEYFWKPEGFLIVTIMVIYKLFENR